MSDTVLATTSLIVASLLMMVLIVFIQNLTVTLTRTGRRLTAALPITAGIRRDCLNIIDDVLLLNRNLGAAANGLVAVAATAKQRATLVTRTAAPVPAAVTEPVSSPTRPLTPRRDAHAQPQFVPPVSRQARPVRELRDPNRTSLPPRQSDDDPIRREFRIRGEEQTA